MYKLIDNLGDYIIESAEKLHNLLAGAMKPHYDRGETITNNSSVYRLLEAIFCAMVAVVCAVIFLTHTLMLCAIGGVAKMFDDK